MDRVAFLFPVLPGNLHFDTEVHEIYTYVDQNPPCPRVIWHFVASRIKAFSASLAICLTASASITKKPHKIITTIFTELITCNCNKIGATLKKETLDILIHLIHLIVFPVVAALSLIIPKRVWRKINQIVEHNRAKYLPPKPPMSPKVKTDRSSSPYWKTLLGYAVGPIQIENFSYVVSEYQKMKQRPDSEEKVQILESQIHTMYERYRESFMDELLAAPRPVPPELTQKFKRLHQEMNRFKKLI